MKRKNGRKHDELRPLKLTYDFCGQASASLLFELGRTKIICAVTLQSGVPPFLRGSQTGWLTAEYAMLPTATAQRTQRESTTQKRNNRSIEISRFISRCLRTIVDLSVLGEQTIIVDCDVLQADAGTRVASLTAASMVLQKAQERWLKKGTIEKPFLTDQLAAVSIVITDDQLLLDPDYTEDSQGNADVNFVCTRSGKLIEIQGGAEKEPISWEQLEQAKDLAIAGVEAIFVEAETKRTRTESIKTDQKPLFSLARRVTEKEK